MSWNTVPVVDHEEVVGTCQSCHNGTYANPKPVNHPPTSNDCEQCHNTYSWTTIAFNHAGIVDNCVRCHNGSTATGKAPKHILTDNVCEDCHTTNFWVPVTVVDHAHVIGSCSSCHNGTVATGKPPNHVPTTAECNACHSTLAWKPALFDHAGIVSGCAQCHDGVRCDRQERQSHSNRHGLRGMPLDRDVQTRRHASITRMCWARVRRATTVPVRRARTPATSRRRRNATSVIRRSRGSLHCERLFEKQFAVTTMPTRACLAALLLWCGTAYAASPYQTARVVEQSGSSVVVEFAFSDSVRTTAQDIKPDGIEIRLRGSTLSAQFDQKDETFAGDLGPIEHVSVEGSGAGGYKLSVTLIAPMTIEVLPQPDNRRIAIRLTKAAESSEPEVARAPLPIREESIGEPTVAPQAQGARTAQEAAASEVPAASIPSSAAGADGSESTPDVYVKALDDGRQAAMSQDYPRAIALYTKASQSTDTAIRQEALEMLATARERNHQDVQAKVIYDQFLAEYPDSEAAPRIRQRLSGLLTRNLPVRKKLIKPEPAAGTWTAVGNVSQFYQRNEIVVNGDKAGGWSRRHVHECGRHRRPTDRRASTSACACRPTVFTTSVLMGTAHIRCRLHISRHDRSIGGWTSASAASRSRVMAYSAGTTAALQYNVSSVAEGRCHRRLCRRLQQQRVHHRAAALRRER